MGKRVTRAEATRAAETLKPFLSAAQMAVIMENCRGEEKQFFFDKLVGFAERVSGMPEVYGQDGMGDEAVVHLHYFHGSFDFWVTEKDTDPRQIQAFGYADMGDPELGYICIADIVKHGGELDLHFEPTTLREVKEERYGIGKDAAP